MSKSPLTILISAGPTLEPIDPVRFISNHSSGKMGYALTEAALKLGANVILVSGPTALKPPAKCHFLPVKTTREMQKAMLEFFPAADITIMVAAVADYRCEKIAKQKIKKTSDTLTLKLIKNPDILKQLGQKKKPGQILVGFAAETKNALAYGKKKLKEKNLDWIVINNVAQKGIGFGSDENEVILLSSTGQKFSFNKQAKTKLAQNLLQNILK